MSEPAEGEGGAQGRPAGARWTEEAEREAAALVSAALGEDIGTGDCTTLWAIEEGVEATGAIVAKEPLAVAGTRVARTVFLEVDPALEVTIRLEDGAWAEAGDEVMRIRGAARGILTAERTALNFLGRLSGIATLTRRFVSEVEGTEARIVDTRKTTPGWRHLEKWAVRMGGGTNHRMGLHDMVLVKDNHIAVAGGIPEAVRRVRERNRAGLRVQVEVEEPGQIEALREFEVDRILLDNMDDAALREAVRIVAEWPEPRPGLEASGNMTLERVGSVARTGVDWISVGALTHSPRAADLSLQLWTRNPPRRVTEPVGPEPGR